MTESKTLLDNNEFHEFMVAAKRATYASGGEVKAIQLADGGKMYTFNDERWQQWRYTDEWYGTGPLQNPFFGREIYCERTDTYGSFVRVAHMAYDGHAVGDETHLKQTFAFLGEVLKKVDRESLFRGPTTLTVDREFSYICAWHRLDKFRIQGHEYIWSRKLSTNKAHYHLNFQFCCLR